MVYKTEHPGITIRRRLAERRLSQAELARQTGYSTKHISMVLNGHVGVSTTLISRVAAVLDMDAHTLMEQKISYELEHERAA